MTKEISLLLCLLRAALWQISPDAALFVDVNEDLWKKIMNLAVRHSVFALAFDGAMLLPKEVQPPRMLQLSWIVQVDKIEKKYAYKLSVLQQMETIFAENNIKMLHFKGFSLAKCYPTPEHREFGDLDIYLFGKHDEGNELLVKNGATDTDSYVDKHSVLIYKNVSIENHRQFLGENYYSKQAEKYLIEILNNCQSVNSLNDFPVDFNMLFHIFHICQHLSAEQVPLRMLTDLTMFLNKYKDGIDFEKINNQISEIGFQQQKNACFALCIKYFGLNENIIPKFEHNFDYEEKIWQHILNTTTHKFEKNKSNPFSVFHFKYKRLLRRTESSQLIFPSGKFNKFISSLKFKLKHPDTIFRFYK